MYFLTFRLHKDLYLFCVFCQLERNTCCLINYFSRLFFFSNPTSFLFAFFLNRLTFTFSFLPQKIIFLLQFLGHTKRMVESNNSDSWKWSNAVPARWTYSSRILLYFRRPQQQFSEICRDPTIFLRFVLYLFQQNLSA